MSDFDSAFANFSDDIGSVDQQDYSDPAESREPVDSPFVILVDSREQVPYTFENISGGFRDEYAPIKVRTKRKGLKVGDYSLENFQAIAIERKSKSDLFGSVGNNQKRENFIERLRKMQSTLEYGAIIIECYPEEIMNDPPSHTHLNPKTVMRTSFSWSIQFPLIHWHFAANREAAEQTTYRILEKFYQHKTDLRYKHHNKPIDQHLEIQRSGIVARMSSLEYENPYSEDHDFAKSFQQGWYFAGTNIFGGVLGTLYRHGEMPKLEPEPKSKRGSKKDSESKHVPLPGQTSFLDELEPETNRLVNEVFSSIKKQKLAKNPKRKKA